METQGSEQGEAANDHTPCPTSAAFKNRSEEQRTVGAAPRQFPHKALIVQYTAALTNSIATKYKK